MALVGLIQIFGEAELFATPKPAPMTLERARRSRRRRPQGPTIRHDPRKHARAQNEPTSEATPSRNTRNSRGSNSNVPPHGALGGFALTTATLVASTPTSSSGFGRLGDGGRGATKRWGKAVCVEECVPFVIGVGRRLRGTRGLGDRSRGCRGCRGSRGVGGWLRPD